MSVHPDRFADAETALLKRLQAGEAARKEATELAEACRTADEARRFVRLVAAHRDALAPLEPDDAAGAFASELLERASLGWPETPQGTGELGRVMLAWYFSFYR